MSALKIKDGIHWLGALDPDLRVFDVVMETIWGTTYNSYLVKGESKTALIDVVKKGFGDGHLNKVRELVDPKEIDYIIINHSEPDHSGSLKAFLSEAVNAVVVSSKPANLNLKGITNCNFPERIVKDGDSIDLGGKTLRFISAPFLHWPDTIFTYVEEDGVLFTGDAFGCHYCPGGGRIFDDEMDDEILIAQKYYFDIIMSPFKGYMMEAIGKIRHLNPDIVCPSHGPILRSKPWDVINRLEEWSRDIYEKNDPPKVFIGYVSAYGNTKLIAEAAAEGIRQAGRLDVEILDVSREKLDDVLSKIEKADGLLIGSPTINRDSLPPIWQVMSHISIFKCKGKPCGVFGSYGWSGEAVKLIEDRLNGLQMRVVVPALRIKMVPDAIGLEEAREFGRKFAHAVLDKQ